MTASRQRTADIKYKDKRFKPPFRGAWTKFKDFTKKDPLVVEIRLQWDPLFILKVSPRYYWQRLAKSQHQFDRLL